MRIILALTMVTALMSVGGIALAQGSDRIDSGYSGVMPPEPDRKPLWEQQHAEREAQGLEEGAISKASILEGQDGLRLEYCDDMYMPSCHYSGSNIICQVPDVSARPNIVAVGYAYQEDPDHEDAIIMCFWHPALSEWVPIGMCWKGSKTGLFVYGSQFWDQIGFVNEETYLNDACYFEAFQNDFTYRSIDGLGGCDEAYGSWFADTRLEGEYVDGNAGGDHIHLTNDGMPCDGIGNYPQALGKRGADTIEGSPSADYVWGDSPSDSTAAGADTIYGNGGADALAGYWLNDNIYGGDGNDYAWGGDDNDHLSGESGNDYLYGENGYDSLNGGANTDYCNCGAGSDPAAVACETIVSCND